MTFLSVGAHNPPPNLVDAHWLGDDGAVMLNVGDELRFFFRSLPELDEFLGAASRRRLALEPGRRPMTSRERAMFERYDRLLDEGYAPDGSRIGPREALDRASALYPIVGVSS